jgi:hypothetical protein
MSLKSSKRSTFLTQTILDSVALAGNIRLNATPHIANAMANAIKIATSALMALDVYPEDPKVKEMCRTILGDDPIKLARAKGKSDDVLPGAGAFKSIS